MRGLVRTLGQRALAGFAALLAAGCNGVGDSPPVSRPSATVATGGIQFTDVSAARGLTYRYTPHGTSPLNILQLTTGAGAAFLDYDGDGWLDILCVGWPRPALFHSERGERFTDVTEAAGLRCAEARWSGCAVGDYDNDGRPDLFLTAHNRTALFRNTGRGFQDVTAATGAGLTGWCTSASFTDVDRDGFLDLYVARYVKFDDTMPQFSKVRGVSLSLGPEVYEPQRGVFLRNLGGKRFQDATVQAGLSAAQGKALGVAFADPEGKGRDDLYVANDRQMQDYFQNEGGGRFTRVSQRNGTAYDSEGRPQGGMGVDFADFNGDGLLDLFVANFAGEPKSLYRNLGGGLWTHAATTAQVAEPTRPWVAFGTRFLDADNDGYQDLAVVNGHVQDTIQQVDPGNSYRQRSQLFRGGPEGRFTDVSHLIGAAFQKPIVGRALASGDFDNDGRVDLLAADLDGAPLLLRNESKTTNHWISLRLIGTRSNRMAIGARVTVTTSGPKPQTQVREVRTDGSYLAAHDPRIHFGLGSATTVERVEIRWPSGKRQVLQAPKVDQLLDVTEP